MVAALTSSNGVISLLEESSPELRHYALTHLNVVVDQFWAEIADSVGKIETLYEDEKFVHRELAALVASKVYYHLGQYDDSVSFALGAGKLFDVNAKSEYIETIVARSIDKYIELRNSSNPVIDPRLTSVFERMVQRSFNDKQIHQAIGVGLESRRLDIVENAIQQCSHSEEVLNYTRTAAMTLVQSSEFRNQVLEMLVKVYGSLKVQDWLSICQIHVFLNDPVACSQILSRLVSEKSEILSYQIAFDLYDNAKQEFLLKLIDAFKSTPDCDQKSKIISIISGDVTIKLHLEFLYRNNNTDKYIIAASKDSLDARSSIYHSGLTISNSFMNAGTTNDQFLRDNMDWLGKASNWTRFTATATLGAIHKGHMSHGMALLKPYLPQDGVAGSPYSEGGALMALGLIHANHGSGALDYLLKTLKSTQSEIIQHGASLGLGLSAMATDNNQVYEELKAILYTDSAVAGEAAGLAMGLVKLGTGNAAAIDEMLQYAHETQHEKIIRGLAMGLAMIMFGLQEQADGLIEQLMRDKDPLLRYGGIYVIAMAYAGTGNNKAIRKLLHFAVSDTNDEVRKASVTSLGFILFRTPKEVPRMVQLLAESYNPFVRQGATLALGIACAGTGYKEAIQLLEPMTKDTVDFVRQGAFLALAMISMQHNDVSCPSITKTRELFKKVISNKHEEKMVKLGAVLAQGIIDAGGRNVAITLKSPTGHLNMVGVVGCALFAQFWYWYPFSLFLTLSFNPTGIIGLDKNLNIPKFDFISNAKPSLFAYPEATKPPTALAPEKIATAVLSTTAKAKARAKKAEKDKGDAMEVDEKPEEKSEEKTEKPEEKAAVPEATSQTLPNFARVLPRQLKYVSFPENNRYKPIVKFVGGITLMVDNKPTQPVELIETAVPIVENKAEGEEPAPPEPFEYPNV